jgi:hypothetical protein
VFVPSDFRKEVLYRIALYRARGILKGELDPGSTNVPPPVDRPLAKRTAMIYYLCDEALLVGAVAAELGSTKNKGRDARP